MPHTYERSMRPRSSHIDHHRMEEGGPEPTRVSLSEDLKEYGRCPRPHCGGLLVRRTTVTGSGSCEELVCTSCSRGRLLYVHEPYPPMRADRDPEMEAACTPLPRREERGCGLEEVEVPRAVAEVLRVE